MTTDTSATRNRTGTAARPMPGQTMGDPRRFNVKGWLRAATPAAPSPQHGRPTATAVVVDHGA
jgi:hypothetical protein